MALNLRYAETVDYAEQPRQCRLVGVLVVESVDYPAPVAADEFAVIVVALHGYSVRVPQVAGKYVAVVAFVHHAGVVALCYLRDVEAGGVVMAHAVGIAFQLEVRHSVVCKGHVTDAAFCRVHVHNVEIWDVTHVAVAVFAAGSVDDRLQYIVACRDVVAWQQNIYEKCRQREA